MDHELDAFSRFAVPLMLSRFPEWEPYATVLSRDGGDVVEVNISCPSQAAESGLWVSTENDEFSVGFHTHHCHFNNYETPNTRDVVQRGLHYAAEVLEERIGVLSWYRGAEFAGSTSIDLPHSGTLLDPHHFVANIVAKCDRATLRSWLGRFDQDDVRV